MWRKKKHKQVEILCHYHLPSFDLQEKPSRTKALFSTSIPCPDKVIPYKKHFLLHLFFHCPSLHSAGTKRRKNLISLLSTRDAGRACDFVSPFPLMKLSLSSRFQSPRGNAPAAVERNTSAILLRLEEFDRGDWFFVDDRFFKWRADDQPGNCKFATWATA